MTSQLNSVFITDQGYLMPTVTAIVSLVENLNREDSCHVYVIAVDLDDASRSRLEQLKMNWIT